MNFSKLALPVLLGTLAFAHPPSATDSVLFEACGRDPYYKGKRGFHNVDQAKNHAYKEFRSQVGARHIDPSTDEWFCYLYTLRTGDAKGPLFFHSPWRLAVFQKTENGSMRHLVQSPLVPTEDLQVYSMMHSHPTRSHNGAGPSRVDVATASRYKNADGSYRYLYLINNHGSLVPFKARRDIDPNDAMSLLSIPVLPKKGQDWIDQG